MQWNSSTKEFTSVLSTGPDYGSSRIKPNTDFDFDTVGRAVEQNGYYPCPLVDNQLTQIDIRASFAYNSQITFDKVGALDQYTGANVILLINDKQVTWSPNTRVFSHEGSTGKHSVCKLDQVLATPAIMKIDYFKDNTHTIWNSKCTDLTNPTMFYLCSLWPLRSNNAIGHSYSMDELHSNTSSANNLNNWMAFGVSRDSKNRPVHINSLYATSDDTNGWGSFSWNHSPANGNVLGNAAFHRAYMSSGEKMRVKDIGNNNTFVTVCVLEPSPFMKLYFALTNGPQKTRLYGMINYRKELFLLIPLVEENQESDKADLLDRVRTTLGWVDSNNKPTYTVHKLLNDWIPKYYNTLSRGDQLGVIEFYKNNTNDIIYPDEAFTAFALKEWDVNSKSVFLQEYPECGCFMPKPFMDTFWDAVGIPSGAERVTACAFQNCYDLTINPLRNKSLMLNKQVCSSTIKNITNCIANLSVSNSGTIRDLRNNTKLKCGTSAGGNAPPSVTPDNNDQSNDEGKGPTDNATTTSNTLMYAGIGAAVLIFFVLAIWMLKRRNSSGESSAE